MLMANASSIENIETARLTGRRIQSEDLALIRQMHCNSQLMATLGGLRTAEESIQMHAAHLEHWNREGFGVWMWHSRMDRRFIACGGLRKTAIEGNEETEVLYALAPEFWGHGLATEIARASANIAFTRLGLRDVVAFTLPTNLASRRVMEKCGFVFERDIIWKDLPHVLYRLRLV